MAYSSSPRPTFDGPTHIPYAAATRHLWGDPISGEVADWIYVSSGKIHQLMFGVPPGGAFRHSEDFRTVFGADEVLYVLSGVMLLANPETGEVHRVEAGEGAFFRRDTWHHAFNHSTEPLRVVEWFAPPPSTGTSGAYAQSKPNLIDPHYSQDRWLGSWPMARDEIRHENTILPLRATDAMWRLEGRENQILVGLWVATEHLTVGQIQLLPGQHSDPQCHGGDESLYLLEGVMHVRAMFEGKQRWFELNPGDGFYVPESASHEYYNMSGTPVRFMFGVGPHYLPAE